MTRIFSAGLFVLAMLLFLLPWTSTDWPNTYEVSGADLVLGRDVPDVYGRERNVDPEPFAIALLALGVAGAALSLSKGKRGCAMRGLAGWMGFALAVLIGILPDPTPEIESGLWLTRLVFGIAAFWNAVAFVRLQGVRGIRKPWLAALLNLIPVVPGAGYLYLGRPRRFVFSLVGYTVIPSVAFVLLVLAMLGGGCSQAACFYFSATAMFGIPVFLYLALVAWDAWHLADESGRVKPKGRAVTRLARAQEHPILSSTASHDDPRHL